MKILLSVFLGIAVIGCVLLLMAFSSVNGDLGAAKSQLDNARAQLTSAQDDLTSTQTQLTQTRADLAQAQTDLQTTMDDLNDKSNELSKTELELTGARLDLTDVSSKLNTALGQVTGFFSDYASIRDRVNVINGEGEDSELFVTPDDPDVADITLSVAGRYSQSTDEVWNDYQLMYTWVVDNIEYNLDSKMPYLPDDAAGEIIWTEDCWRTPAETLAAGAGDCEDMANLLASMMLNYNGREYGVWSIVIQNDDSGHVAVCLPVVGDQLVIFDPAGYFYSGQDLGYVKSYPIATAVNQWLTHWAAEMPGAEITEVFSYDFYREFENTQVFIAWATDRYSN